MKHIISLLTMASVLCSMAQTPVERIFLKNGSKLEGYIAEQIPGGKMNFKASEADMADGNNDENFYTLTFDEVVRLERICEKNMLVQDVIKTRAGEDITGHILSSIPGKSLTILKKNGGKKHVKFSDVLSETRQITSDETWTTRLRYLDIVNCKDGEVYQGFLKTKFYGDDEQEAYLIVETSDSEEQKIPTDKVKSIKKERNKSYKDYVPARLKESEIIVKGDTIKTYSSMRLENSRSKEYNQVLDFPKTLNTSIISGTTDFYEATVILPRDADPKKYAILLAKFCKKDNKRKSFTPVTERKSANAYWFDQNYLADVEPEYINKLPNGEHELMYKLDRSRVYIFMQRAGKNESCKCIVIKTQ